MSKNTIIKLTKSLPSSQLYYEDDILGLYIGVWDNGDVIEAWSPSTSDAFITLITGEVGIESNNTGNNETVVAGESFVIPKGYNTHWHSLTPLLTFCVTYTPKATETISPSPTFQHIIRINEHSNTSWQATSDGFHKKVQYQSHNQKFTAGVWQGKDFQTGIISFPYNEFILIKQGCLICTDEQGEKHKINAGEAFFIPQGVCCAWQVQGTVSLHFAQIKL